MAKINCAREESIVDGGKTETAENIMTGSSQTRRSQILASPEKEGEKPAAFHNSHGLCIFGKDALKKHSVRAHFSYSSFFPFQLYAA